MKTSRLLYLLAFVLFGVGALAVTWPVVLQPNERLPVLEQNPGALPLGDMAVFVHALWWTPEALFHQGQLPWFCPLMGAPDGVSLIYTTLAPLYGLLSAPLVFAGKLILAYNLWVWLAIAAFSFFALVVARQLGASWPGAFLAGFLLFYLPWMSQQVNHLNIISLWWIPAVYGLWLHFLKTRKCIWLYLLALVAGLSFYVSLYHLIHIFLWLGLDIFFRLYRRQGRGKKFRRFFWIGLGTGVLCQSFEPWFGSFWVMAVLGIALVHFLRGWVRSSEGRHFANHAVLAILLMALLWLPFFVPKALDARHGSEEVSIYLETKAFWSAQPILYALPSQWVSHAKEMGLLYLPENAMPMPVTGEFVLFPGFFFWALMAFCLWKGRKRRPARKWLLLAGLFFVFSLGPFIRWGDTLEWFPGYLIFAPAVVSDLVPFLNGYRVFARLAMLVYLALALYAGLQWRFIWGSRWGGNRPRAFILVALLALPLLAERIEWPHPAITVEPSPYFEKLCREETTRPFLTFPVNNWVFALPQTIHKKPLINYYSSRLDEDNTEEADNLFLWTLSLYDRTPPHPDWEPPERPTLEKLQADFKKLGIAGVLIHRDFLHRGDAEILHSLLHGALGLERAYQDDRLSVYR